MIGGGSSSKQPDPLYVDLGLPSGRLWAKSNLDVTQPNGFAASPFQYECSYFSWGNVDGYNPIPGNGFTYNWGGINAQEPWYNNQPYGLTNGASLNRNIPQTVEYDAARAKLNLPWRLPSSADFKELIDNTDFVEADGITIISRVNKIIEVNGCSGIYLKSKINGELLFLSCAGDGSGTKLNALGTQGYYWASTFHSARHGRCLSFIDTGVSPQNYKDRYIGFTIRPVI